MTRVLLIICFAVILVQCDSLTVKFPPIPLMRAIRDPRTISRSDVNVPSINNITDSWTFVLNSTGLTGNENKTDLKPDDPKNFRVLYLLDLNFTNMERSYLPPATITLNLEEDDTSAKEALNSGGTSVKPMGTVTGTSHLIQDVIPLIVPVKGEEADDEKVEPTPSERMWSFINFHANNVLQFNARVNMSQENVTYTVQTLTNDRHSPTLQGPGKFSPTQQQMQPADLFATIFQDGMGIPSIPSLFSSASKGQDDSVENDDDNWRRENPPSGESVTSSVS